MVSDEEGIRGGVWVENGDGGPNCGSDDVGFCGFGIFGDGIVMEDPGLGSRAIFGDLLAGFEESVEIILCDGIEAVPEGWELNAIMGADDTGVRWVLGLLDHQGISFSNCESLGGSKGAIFGLKRANAKRRLQVGG